jgi:hypothetical protein
LLFACSVASVVFSFCSAGMEPRASCMLSKCSSTKLHPQP